MAFLGGLEIGGVGHQLRVGAAVLATVGWALGLFGTAVASQPADDGPRQLLERMNRALAEVQFDGTLVYLHGQDLAALRVSHRVRNGMAGESLLSLTGPVRTMSRHAQGVTCMLPDAAPLTVHTAHEPGGILRSVPLDFARIARHYRVEPQGRFRIAGRDTDVVGLIARDAYRYGYRFYLDQVSGLPLKVDLLLDGDDPVQQIMFTDIVIDASDVADAGLLPAAAPTDASVDIAGGSTGPGSGWGPRQMPPGFRLISRKRIARDDGESTLQLVVSDGLAAFSIYVEPPMDGALQGESRLGAISAAGGRVGTHQVTVVGEVPPTTAREVLSSVAPPDDR